MNTCRFCKKTTSDDTTKELLQYGPRHWAHADCGISELGATSFIGRIRGHCLPKFPILAYQANLEALTAYRRALESCRFGESYIALCDDMIARLPK